MAELIISRLEKKCYLLISPRSIAYYVATLRFPLLSLYPIPTTPLALIPTTQRSGSVALPLALVRSSQSTAGYAAQTTDQLGPAAPGRRPFKDVKNTAFNFS
jgi:hypothetical protein